MSPKEVKPVLFAAVASAPKVSFWQALDRKKLEVWRLDSGKQSVVAQWSAAPAPSMGPRLELVGAGLDEQTVDEGFYAAHGSVHPRWTDSAPL